MRRALIAIALAAAPAAAGPASSNDAPSHGDDSFWRDVLEPHHDEVVSLLARCREGLKTLDTTDVSDTLPPPSVRRAALREIESVLRYVHRLEPDNADALRMLARTADESGDARVARDALRTLVELVGEERAGDDALDRMGVAAIDAGRIDEAVRVLRIAQGPVTAEPAAASVLVHLSTALALAGHTADAIDVLADAVPGPGQAFYPSPSELTLVGFALAVQYDRDEQRGAAFDILDRMKSALGDQLPLALQSALDQMRFAPAEDERYYRALMDEIVGDYAEARTEWLLYAADDGARYRRRALDHARAIDTLPPAQKVPSLVIPTTPPPPMVVP